VIEGRGEALMTVRSIGREKINDDRDVRTERLADVEVVAPDEDTLKLRRDDGRGAAVGAEA